MGRKCNVEGCQSDSNRPQDAGVTFHKVPPHNDIRPKWLSLCKIPEDKKHVKVLYVCSRHFLRADFCNFKGKKYMLRQGVLPSVFPWDKSKLEAIKAEAKREKRVEIKEEQMDIKLEPELQNKTSIREEGIEENIKQDNENENQTEVKTEPNQEPEDNCNKQPSLSTVSTLNFSINSKVEALDFNNEWFPAQIVEIDYEENEVLIHFENFSSKYDEWISMDSSRLRPLKNTEVTEVKKVDTTVNNPTSNTTKKTIVETYVIGERCLAVWSDSRKFPATVTKILENDTYEILFDDGYVKTSKANKMYKTQGKPLHSSPLFDPIKSSKQDRREKKRKLNVADLFKKRPRMENSETKKLQAQTNNSSTVNPPPEVETSLPPEVPILAPSPVDIENWRPSWYKGKPVGVESTLQTQDGIKTSYIVPDPRLPPGWNKHLLRRSKGCDARKWDTVIVSPQNKKFRSKTDIVKYLEEHSLEGVTEKMFDFSMVSKRKRKNPNSSTAVKSPEKQVATPLPPPAPLPPPVEVIPEEPIEPEAQIKEEDSSSSLKILFEDDAYKCPIEGCGKNFRRENLAQMHVKHYHPEYTKFLDSTPNVADLAYARTVGENLDRSPGPQKPPIKQVVRSATPKTPKHSASFTEETPELKPAVKPKLPPTPKTKDQEIIKLLNTKPYNKQDGDSGQPQPIGITSPPYPELKLKDLLAKSDSVPSDLNLKHLLKSKPSTGIKTLLPVHRPQIENSVGEQTAEDYNKSLSKRKSGYIENIEIIKGIDPIEQKSSSLTLSTPPPTATTTPPPLSLPPKLPSPLPPPILTPPTDLQSHNPNPTSNDVIIEGGEVIKIVRMKQEEIINCTCGFTEEDGLMIQCELCLCWQHAYCNNIERESQVPEKYVCYICQNPLRERMSRKYYHDQDWLTKGVLPVGSYHSKDEDMLRKRFDKLKKCHDLSGGLIELGNYQHSLKIKMKIAEAKNHPKLYLWSKPWPKLSLPEKVKAELGNTKPKLESEDAEYLKNDFDVDKESQNENSMLMMLLKAGKNLMPKIDLNTLMDNNSPIIPQPEAVIDSADCRLNLLEHLVHQFSLVEERLDNFEKQVQMLEEGINVERDVDYPRTRNTLQMLMRDLDTLKDFSHSSAI